MLSAILIGGEASGVHMLSRAGLHARMRQMAGCSMRAREFALHAWICAMMDSFAFQLECDLLLRA